MRIVFVCKPNSYDSLMTRTIILNYLKENINEEYDCVFTTIDDCVKFNDNDTIILCGCSFNKNTMLKLYRNNKLYWFDASADGYKLYLTKVFSNDIGDCNIAHTNTYNAYQYFNFTPHSTIEEFDQHYKNGNNVPNAIYDIMENLFEPFGDDCGKGSLFDYYDYLGKTIVIYEDGIPLKRLKIVNLEKSDNRVYAICKSDEGKSPYKFNIEYINRYFLLNKCPFEDYNGWLYEFI